MGKPHQRDNWSKTWRNKGNHRGGAIAERFYMTENLASDVSAPAQSQAEAPANDSSVASADNSAPAQSTTTESTAAEKLLPQSQVDKIISGRLKDQQSKLERQYEQKLAQIQQSQSQTSSQNQQPSNVGGMQGMTEPQIRQLIDQEATRRSTMEYANRVAQSYTQKISSELNGDPEFVEIYNDLKLEQQHPYLIPLLNDLDNTAAVIKDMGKNSSKFANILMLVNSGNQELAFRDLKKLSDSIKANEAAKKQEIPPAPLSQMKPSHLSAGDGKMTVRDYKANPKFRG